VSIRITHEDLAVAQARHEPFDDAGWIFELKYDGFRALARGGRQASLTSRRGTNLLPSYPEIGKALRALPDVVLDGELVIAGDDGKPDFEALSWRLRLKDPGRIAAASQKRPAVLLAFDILARGSKDLRSLPLIKRKEALARALKGSKSIKPVPFVSGAGRQLFEVVDDAGLEGIVAKPADSTYARSKAARWFKMKTKRGREIDRRRAEWNR
jgi:bifunctional non-homologous end joining protein LigD